jgi:hypothetical protein
VAGLRCSAGDPWDAAGLRSSAVGGKAAGLVCLAGEE